MSEFAAALEETRILHRKSDLTNLANAQLNLEEFRREINAKIDGFLAEIKEVAENEWPPEGVIRELYDRTHDFTRDVDTTIYNLERKRDKKFS